jgi:hypothetical protein
VGVLSDILLDTAIAAAARPLPSDPDPSSFEILLPQTIVYTRPRVAHLPSISRFGPAKSKSSYPTLKRPGFYRMRCVGVLATMTRLTPTSISRSPIAFQVVINHF